MLRSKWDKLSRTQHPPLLHSFLNVESRVYILFLEVNLSVWFHIVEGFPKRPLGKPPISLRWGSHQHKLFINSSCHMVGSVLLITKMRICSVPLKLLWRRHVRSPLPSPPLQTPFIHRICDISFTHRLSCFLGKQKSKTVVVIFSRILKDKNPIS